MVGGPLGAELQHRLGLVGTRQQVAHAVEAIFHQYTGDLALFDRG